LSERGLSARTVRYTHSVLRSSMRQAIRWQLLAEDPTNGAQLPRQRRRELRVLTAEQSRLFLETAMQTAYGPVFAVALTTATRPSEYLALKWQDINWERGTVSIARTLERMRGGWRFAETKRNRSRRAIKLQGWVLELRHDLYSKREPKPARETWPEASDLVFTIPSGRPIDSAAVVGFFTNSAIPTQHATCRTASTSARSSNRWGIAILHRPWSI
jgi:integrase